MERVAAAALAASSLIFAGGAAPAGPVAPPSAAAVSTEAVARPEPALSVTRVNGVDLHVLDRGAGTPVVFVHGGLADYSEWLPAAAALPPGYRTLLYSRRHSFPNRNGPPRPDHSMLREVEDLAALIEALEVGPVHVVGVSYGGFTALMLALRRPELVRSVVSAEAPLLDWLPDIEGGREARDHFYRSVMAPSAAAFAAGDPDRALAVTLDYFVGPNGIDAIPAAVRERLAANLDDWRAITTAPGAFAPVTRDELSAIRVPVLLISGSETAAVHRLIDPEVARTIPGARRVMIAGGTHDMCAEQPGECATAIHDFIRRQRN
jgi:non-heme chloroperoxidase